MPTSKISDQVGGKTLSFAWTDGPTKGMTHEHIFHDDGTVEWHSINNDKAAAPASGDEQSERPPYVGVKITDDVCLVSYLSKSGYTLSVVLNFSNGSVVGIASNEKNWVPVKGSIT